MKMAHKIELAPNNKQQTYLAKWSELYKQGVKGPSGYSLKKIFNTIKHEVTEYASHRAFIDLQNGFTRFFNKIGIKPMATASNDKFTTYLMSDYTTIAIKNLNVSGVIKNHNLALAINDVGMWKFRCLLEYKTAQLNERLYGGGEILDAAVN
jgi:hypothetical protein